MIKKTIFGATRLKTQMVNNGLKGINLTTTLVILFSCYLNSEQEKENELAKIVNKIHAFQTDQIRGWEIKAF